MVQAVCDNDKTQTRILMKPQPKMDPVRMTYSRPGKPLYAIGDILWVRETFRKVINKDNVEFIDYKAKNLALQYNQRNNIVYIESGDEPIQWSRWIPSIHMPVGFARVFLRVIDVKASRIQDISNEDVIKEGFDSKENFIEQWDKAYHKRGFGWKQNPWVWIIEFKNIDLPDEV